MSKLLDILTVMFLFSLYALNKLMLLLKIHRSKMDFYTSMQSNNWYVICFLLCVFFRGGGAFS